MNFYSSWWAAAHVELLQKYRAVLQIALILREMGEWASRGDPCGRPDLVEPGLGRSEWGGHKATPLQKQPLPVWGNGRINTTYN